ncbi:Protein yceI precursor [hydrothermal vent metagenome]|uniref:Protein yceI n=1 Tax=hydrothermal vent metagenome TaxID=652676 RepID=A0A3B0XXH6_9ZZZZ
MKPLNTIVSAVVMSLSALLGLPVVADAADAGKYIIDQDHSGISFSVSHMGYSDLQGRFNKMEGKFTLNPGKKSTLELVIKTASVDSNHDKRDKHLRSPDFLNSKRYPEMKFNASDVKFNAKGEVVKIMGSLTLHGKTRPVTLNVTPMRAAKDPWGNYRAGYVASATIKRSDFGMNFMQDGIGDNIALNISIEAIKQ